MMASLQEDQNARVDHSTQHSKMDLSKEEEHLKMIDTLLAELELGMKATSGSSNSSSNEQPNPSMMASLKEDQNARGDHSTQHNKLNSSDNIPVTEEPDLDIWIAERDYTADQPGHLSLHRDEKILILQKGEDEFKGINSSAVIGYVPKDYITKDYSLENYSWYHGEISREKAEFLLEKTRIGSFLVRDSSNYPLYALSMCMKKEVFHFLLDRHYFQKSEAFETMPELVLYYNKNFLGTGPNKQKALHPVPNQWARLKISHAKKSERRQKVCEKVLQKKCLIPIIAVIFNYLGLPRSGKTSLRRRITGEIENIMAARQRGEIEQPSTGIVEDGGQVLIKPSSLEMGTIRSKVWSVLKNLGDEANMLNQFFHQIVDNSEEVDDSQAANSEIAELSTKSPNYVLDDTVIKHPFWKTSFMHKNAAQTKVEVVPATAEDKAKLFPASPEADGEKDDEMFAIIREAMEFDNSEEINYLLEDTILLVNNDTGGHAEFLDLQAALIQGPSFNLFFSRLVDDLDSLFKIYYTNEEGKSTDKEDSTMTVEEVMYQALASIACFSGAYADKDSRDGTKKSQSKVMFVGTHRDMVSEEEFRAKDENLRKKIESTEFYKKGIVEYVSEDQLMLAVDNMNGDQAEIEGVQSILEKVIEESFVKISIPAAWLVLSLYLRKKKFRTISLTECEKLAGKLGINPEELQDALWFLHHRVGVLLYYPEVEAMRDTVICQMQVVFDSASNLIRNTFTFEKVGQYVSKEFREKGRFSLKNVKKAVSGHADSLIPLEKLVMLLQHLNVLTPIIPSTPFSTGESHCTPEPTYFMPCVLQSARASELKIETSAEDPSPLMLRYECGYVPMGMFPSMITNLVSQQLEGWKLIERGLYKNRVQFRVGDNYDIVTLILHPRYLEISITRNKMPISASLCFHVRDVIQSTLNTVTSHMNNYFSMGYKFGFECPTHLGRDHLCVLASKDAKYMECLEVPEDIQTVRLEPHHKIWFYRKDKEFSPSLKFIDLMKWKDESGHLQKFRLASEVSVKWKEFGLQLDMTLNDLEALEREQHGNTKDIWNKVMSHWLAGGGGDEYPASWKGLYTLLDDLDLSEVAKRLEIAVKGHHL